MRALKNIDKVSSNFGPVLLSFFRLVLPTLRAFRDEVVAAHPGVDVSHPTQCTVSWRWVAQAFHGLQRLQCGLDTSWAFNTEENRVKKQGIGIEEYLAILEYELRSATLLHIPMTVRRERIPYQGHTQH